VRSTLITRIDLRDFALGASDIDIVCRLARSGTSVFSLPRLHAKVYVVDDRVALITSANATDGGLRNNWEFGVVISLASEAARIAQLARSGFGSRRPIEPWNAAELERLREPVEGLRTAIPPIRRLRELDPGRLLGIRLTSAARDALLEGLPGWTRLTLEGVLAQRRDTFAVDSVFAACAPLARQRYPRNRHVREKVRQQLQRLRDLGLLEFLGHGKYRRTMRA